MNVNEAITNGNVSCIIPKFVIATLISAVRTTAKKNQIASDFLHDENTIAVRTALKLKSPWNIESNGMFNCKAITAERKAPAKPNSATTGDEISTP